MTKTDIIIIGAGIVGLATAYHLSQQASDFRITILEKEETLAFHQSGRNSGVLHSGIYYKPGSLKARNCRAGKKLMEQFCTEQDIPFQICGNLCHLFISMSSTHFLLPPFFVKLFFGAIQFGFIILRPRSLIHFLFLFFLLILDHAPSLKLLILAH